MDDYAGFCKQRACASFYRRRKYPLGSEERRHCCDEARQFIGYYRKEQKNMAAEIGAVALKTSESVEDRQSGL